MSRASTPHQDENPAAGADSSRRLRMVREQIVARGIRNSEIVAAMEEVPRHAFVLPQYRDQAYDDTPLPIPAQQTISQPYVVALMIRALELRPQDGVLDVGTGSGYAAALLSRIVRQVYSVERHRVLVDYARGCLDQLSYDNVELKEGDGTLGWPEHAPYDAILVSASGPAVPESLKAQLAENGRLVMPVGHRRHDQRLVRLTRVAPRSFVTEELGAVAFVPLVGEQGWDRSVFQ